MERSSYRYEPRPDRNAELRSELVKLARQKPRYGYRLLHALLSRRGHEVNVKRVYRLYLEEGLTAGRKRPKRLVPDRAAEPRLTGPNQEWAMDFIVDGLATGRIERILSVVDGRRVDSTPTSTNSASNIHSSSRHSTLCSHSQDRTLTVIKGVPEYLRSDNGPEFVARDLRKWLADPGAKTLYIAPDSPWENGYCESFNSKLRDEFLNREIFYSMKEVRVLSERWRVHYNTVRPHSWLGYRPPSPEAWIETSWCVGRRNKCSDSRLPTHLTVAI